ncbi:MAG: glutamate synthase subunit alpha [Chloroflexi bacterium]|nr:MAG: glutamate synthase subunit alpha [Chloroflexota bacterium]
MKKGPQSGQPWMYRPEFERDACGVGFIARLTGRPGHDIIQMSLEAVARMEHRSATDADGRSGDGAGILTQIPHRLLAAEIADLPPAGDYGLAMVFIPPTAVEASVRLIEQTLSPLVSGLIWRDVPANCDALGQTARQTCPVIKQIVIPRPAHIPPGDDFERFLFVARKKIETAAGQQNLDELYICSMSARTVVYKGLMLSPYLAEFYADLQNPAYETVFTTFHARYSTNTTSSWKRAQPFRLLAHNGEINTLQGNVNWMRARESTLHSPYWELDDLRPIIDPTGSDSAMLDNVLELLTRAGRDIHHAVAMLAPEAWENLLDIDPERKAFYRYHAALMEPWDGPAAVVFTDGRRLGATLDRNGLRPLRYLTTGDLVVATSETGVVTLDESQIITKGKLGPGQMILVDLERQIFLTNDQVKNELARRQPYQAWTAGLKPLPTESRPGRFTLLPNNYRLTQPKVNTAPHWLTLLQSAFGYTQEEITVIMRPMAETGKEPTGSMGDDTPPAVLSEKPRPLFHYFKQRFAQVTNPPIDPLRETFVMSLTIRLGARPNLLEETPQHANLIELASPVLSDADLSALKGLGDPRFQTQTIPMRYPVEQGVDGLRRALDRLCLMAERAIDSGKTIIILSDLGIDERHAPIPNLLAVGAVHHHLVRQGKRMRVSLVVESGEVREVHHLACLIGYGANAVNPYLALATVESLVESGKVKLDVDRAKMNFIRAAEAGLLKIMSKMGISIVDSYCGAQIFEAVGLDQTLVDQYFTGTVSRLGGIGLAEIAGIVRQWHQTAFMDRRAPDSPGFYKFKRGGERHAFSPAAVRALHKAVRMPDALAREATQPAEVEPVPDNRQAIRVRPKSFAGKNFEAGYAAYKEFVRVIRENQTISLRDMLEFADSGRAPIPIDEVEPLEDIFMRFSTAAMSHGALSSEAHQTLAIAMNRLGASSNSGEGGSARERFGTEKNDRTKQVASGRFGVTPAYLVSADELQIKMAQGAKPGEGGQLPGHKVSAEIAAIRHTTEGTTLISPPPHHDIYSIEDLAQLIYDLKQINPRAKVSVKLVSVAGVGTVAAGVAKGGADIVHISGGSGGTGAAAWSSIKNVGLPWEMGLSETHQTLRANNLRDRVRVRVDGTLQTGRDLVIAAILGADEFSFGTIAMVAEGCLIARACHSNTCPVGVATQRPELRAKFVGQPEHVMAYMHYVAQEVREILAQMGFRSLKEIIGRTELLHAVPGPSRLNLQPLLAKVDPPITLPSSSNGRAASHPHRIQVGDLNQYLVSELRPAIETAAASSLTLSINNTDRTVGATLAGAIAARYGDQGLPDGTINLTFHGSAGQSFGAFNVNGVNITLIGEANDYVGKGMNGGQIIIRPPLKSELVASDNIIVGNTVLYGATGGSMFIAGRAGERFAVRNSGATAVVEGIGDHGCEYMTGGVVVVLGRVGYNFGAGMSGGVAFVLDEGHYLPQRINPDMVQLVRVTTPADMEILRHLIQRHVRLTGSTRGQAILNEWPTRLGLFWKVAPRGTVGATGVRREIKVSLPTLELSQHVVG